MGGDNNGDLVGGYKLISLLGRGTMGTVHLARPSWGIDRLVAVKRVGVLAGPDERARLIDEAQIMARLDHPHILRILDVIDDEAQNSVAIVMQHAPNGSLADRLRDGPTFTPAELVATIAPIADALGSAHRQGVLHRDVKPSNILFTSDHLAVLADFGIARSLAQAGRTRTDTAMGSAAYLDPEVADGAPAGERSDVYSLAVVCYEALTGAPPYTAELPLAVLRAAEKGEHERLDPAMWGPVADVVERAMARDPGTRPESAAAFADELRRAVAVAVEPTTDRTALVAPAPLVGDGGDVPTGALTDAPISRTAAFRLPHDLDEHVSPEADDDDLELEESGGLMRRRLLRRGPLRPRAKALMGLGAVAAVAIAGVVVVVARAGGSSGDGRDYRRPVCDPSTTSVCVTSWSRTAAGLDVTFANETKPVSFRFGAPTDEARVGNWFCGGRETVAIYRPATGVVYYFDDWPDPDHARAEPRAFADDTGLLNALVSVGDRNGDGCADLALQAGKTRTWFLPRVQSQRLVELGVSRAGEPTPSLARTASDAAH